MKVANWAGPFAKRLVFEFILLAIHDYIIHYPWLAFVCNPSMMSCSWLPITPKSMDKRFSFGSAIWMKRSFLKKLSVRSGIRAHVSKWRPECHCNNAKVSNLESGALDRSAILTAFEEAGDCLFLALNFTSCQEDWLRGTHHGLVVHFNRGCNREERRTSLEQNHPMWLSDKGKQAFKCNKRQHFFS